MGLFLNFRDGETKTLRFFEQEVREYTSGVTGSMRWGRRVIDKGAGTVSVWTYGYPVKKALDQAFAERRVDAYDCDMRITAKGDGPMRRYSIELQNVSQLSEADVILINKCRLTLAVCK